MSFNSVFITLYTRKQIYLGTQKAMFAQLCKRSSQCNVQSRTQRETNIAATVGALGASANSNTDIIIQHPPSQDPVILPQTLSNIPLAASAPSRVVPPTTSSLLTRSFPPSPPLPLPQRFEFKLTTINHRRKRLQLLNPLNSLRVFIRNPIPNRTRLFGDNGQNGRQFGFCQVGIEVGDFLDAGHGGGAEEFVGVAADVLVGEVGEGGVEEEGEDLGERRRVDEVGCFVEETAEGGGGCG